MEATSQLCCEVVQFEETDVKPWFTEVELFINTTTKLADHIEN
jgi:hypothetical protein